MGTTGDVYETKDSGERRSYTTGSVRDRQAGKGRFDLFSPIAMRRVAGVFERGAVKYDARNWEKGQPICASFVDSGLRHVYDYLEGKRDEDHMAQAIWNFMAALHTEEMIERGLLPKELDDRPTYLQKDPGPAAPPPTVNAELDALSAYIARYF